MKKRSRREFVSAISYEDFMAHPEALGKTDRSVTELAVEAQEAERAAKKKDRALKAAKRAK